MMISVRPCKISAKNLVLTRSEQETLIDPTQALEISQHVPGIDRWEIQRGVRSEHLARSKSLGYRLWKAFRFFRRDDIKFAIKVGAGASIYVGGTFLHFHVPVC